MTIRRHNLFLALRPGAKVLPRISRLKVELSRDYGLTGRHLRSDCLHVSLCSLGEHDDLPDRLIARTAAAVEKIRMPPFLVALNRVVGWKGLEGRQPLVLTGDEGIIGIDMLTDQINGCLSEVGILTPPKSPKIPHMTLLRGDVVGFEQIIEPVKWFVQEFVLVDSHVGENRHVVLFRQALS